MTESDSSTDTADHRPVSSDLRSDAALIGVAMIWGINIPIMKTGLGELDLFVFNAIRLTISAVVLAAFAFRERRNGLRPGPAVSLKQLVVYGLCISAIYQVLFLVGIDNTSSGNTALIISTIPLWTALLARVFIAEYLRPAAWMGLVVAFVGTLLVALQHGDVSAGSGQLVGNFIILGSALVWAGGTVYSRPLLKHISPLQLAAAASLVGLPVHLLVAAGRYEQSWPALQSPELWLILAYAGVLSSGLALPMWSYGVRHAGAAHAAIIQNLVPVIAIAAAWLLRGETVTTPQLVGGALILCGLVAMRLSRNDNLPAPRPCLEAPTQANRL